MAPLELDLTTTIDDRVTAHARSVMASVLTTAELDDRFESWPTDAPTGFMAALGTSGSEPTLFVSGASSRGRVQLDCLVDPATPGGPAPALAAAVDAIVDRLEREPEGSVDTIELWGRPAREWHETVAAELAMAPSRALHQMRCQLPVDAEPIPSRDYTDADLEAVLAVNNRAFSYHPDQGGQTVDSFAATMAEPWFRPDGLRVHEREGRIAGFCWTKIHTAPPAPIPLGEIYVIGVDPDFHGQGLGVPMTAAGLDWLAGQGLDTGMLYVEADNVPAIRTYERLGFTVLRTDRAWQRALESS